MQEILRRENMRRKVLVVDDEQINRDILGLIVGQNYDVIYATNGIEAMDAVRENEDFLSLIMLDLLMPQMDGYSVLRELQKSPKTKKIPVIVLTSEKSAEVESLRLGAADFISKPYEAPEVILARVDRSIGLAESYEMLDRTKHDDLTGLYTKDFFKEYCDQHDKFFPDMDMDCIAVNINKFHLINEMYGRAYGDRVLFTVAELLSELADDCLGLACRSTADTFLLYLPHQEDHTAILADYAETARRMLPEVPLSVRVGVYERADKQLELEHRFDRANTACNKLRNSHQSSLGFYSKDLNEKELYNERLMNEMDTALATKQFCVFYQPKYRVSGEKPELASAEALIRWRHPLLGMISPGQFIPLFEENGMVRKADQFVWRETAAQIARWKEKYNRAIPVSVNVSRVDIYDPELENELINIVKENGLEPGDLLLEITESAYTDNSDQIIETVERLRSYGFKIEMDDFGSGYSSLNMLADLPIDALKMDMRFVKNICTKEKGLRLMQLIIDIAKNLDATVIAEGVEEKGQFELLRDAGCDVIQGYYFSRPLPPEEFEVLIEKEEA